MNMLPFFVVTAMEYNTENDEQKQTALESQCGWNFWSQRSDA